MRRGGVLHFEVKGVNECVGGEAQDLDRVGSLYAVVLNRAHGIAAPPYTLLVADGRPPLLFPLLERRDDQR